MAKPPPTPVIKSSTPIASQPNSEALTAVDPAPSTARRDGHSDTKQPVRTSEAVPSSPGVLAPTTVTGGEGLKPGGFKSESKEGVGIASKDGLGEAESRAPETSVPTSAGPSIANSLLADDWEADVFGTDDAGSAGASASQGLGQAKAGPAVTSDFAKMAVAGSANAGEFTLGDEDDFDSDDGF